MNAPLPEAVRKALESVTLDDRYALESGRAFMSGVQALVRLPMLQKKRDAMFGLNTAGFISGYRGSPLGGYDQALWQAKKHRASQDIVFQPGVNEELAATAVWGTQMLDLYPQTRKFDGVCGIWYGKGPGVDRCSDVFKHANMAGTSKHGGVIAIAGDDHIAKSSTAAHQSDHIFKACGLPVFFPSSVQDILDMGLHAFALSRFAGVWSAMKTIQEIVESSSSVLVDPDRVDIILPEDFKMPPGGLHIRWPDAPLEQEARLMDYKWYAALAYVRANRLNHNVFEGPNDRFGIIASGKAYNDTRQALAVLGLDDETCRHVGIRLHKVNVVWPLEETITRDFAEGLQEILVVEAEVGQRLAGVVVGLARSDDAEAIVRPFEDVVVEPVGAHVGERGVPLVVHQTGFLLERRVGPADVQAARRHLEVFGQDDVDAVGVDLHARRRLDDLLDRLHCRPDAGEAAHRERVQAHVEDVLHARGEEHRQAAGLEDVVALVRRRRALGDVVVAGQRDHAAVRRGARHVGVLEDVGAAVDSRALAVPDAEDAVDLLRLGVEIELLRAPHGRGRKLFVDARLEDDVLGREVLLRRPQRLVIAAERRAAVAADEAARVEAEHRVALLL